MLSAEEILQLIQSLIWLLAGVGVFIVGMNFMSEALEKSAGEGMKRLLGKISNNRFSGVGIGAGVTAIIQSSSATSVMVIGLVNAGVMTLMQATPIIMGANIGTTITGVLVALKNDYFNMLMYLFAFAGVMMGFFKKEKIKIAGLLCSGLGLIFVGLNVMSSEQAFGNPLVENLFQGIFSVIDFPLLLILVGVIFTALIQSSSAATGVVITMVSNLAYAAVLFKLKNVNDRYLTAAGWMAASALLSGLMGIKDAGWTEFDPGMLLTIPTAIAGLLGIYQECKAHSEAMLGIDEDLFVQWENYWKWRIGLVAATFACILLIIISKILTLLVLLSVAIGTIVLSILRLVYLYRSAAACRYHLYHYNAKKENTV